LPDDNFINIVEGHNQTIGELEYMNRTYGDGHYVSITVQDNQDGYAGLELHRTSWGKEARIASVLFRDACGEYFVETFNSDVPLKILEELIAEAKEMIKV
jgi:hypothetical protein